MNIKDRLAFLKAGYTKDEIAQMIADDSKPEEQPEQVPADNPKVEDFMAVISSLAEEVKTMKKAIQKENIQDTKIGTDNIDSIDKILESVINPDVNKTEE